MAQVRYGDGCYFMTASYYRTCQMEPVGLAWFSVSLWWGGYLVTGKMQNTMLCLLLGVVI
jgi:hypothetical protein